jgi:hypothetical protein
VCVSLLAQGSWGLLPLPLVWDGGTMDRTTCCSISAVVSWYNTYTHTHTHNSKLGFLLKSYHQNQQRVLIGWPTGLSSQRA